MAERSGMRRGLLGHVARLWRSRDGVAAVEFALVVPILLALFMHFIDFGLAFHERMQLESAARAGAQYAMHDHTDTAAITAAVQAASDLPVEDLTIEVQHFCDCDGTMASCTAWCPSGDYPGSYVRVRVSKDFQALLGFFNVQTIFNTDGVAVVRVQ